MLYQLAHIIRDKFPWLWLFVGRINSLLFHIRYHKNLKDIPLILKKHSIGYNIETISKYNITELAIFFQQQPNDAYTFFKPHGFEEKELKKLVDDKSFLAYIVKKEQKIVGYFFMRCSFLGKAYRGYMTDYKHRRMGINKLMGMCATDICQTLNIPMYGSISPANEASLKSAAKINDIKIIETLSNGDYLIQYLPKEHCRK